MNIFSACISVYQCVSGAFGGHREGVRFPRTGGTDVSLYVVLGITPRSYGTTFLTTGPLLSPLEYFSHNAQLNQI